MAQFMLNALTLSNINRFSKFFHCQNQGKICNNIITKDPTTPQVCRYTTLWHVTDQWRDQWNAATVCPIQWRSPALAGWLSWIVDVDRPSTGGHPKQRNRLDSSPDCLGDHVSGSMNVTFSRRRYVSVFFVDPGAKVDSEYYCQRVLRCGLLPDIRARYQRYSWTLQRDGDTFLPPKGWRSSNIYTLQFSVNCRAYTHQLYWFWYHSPEFLYSF